MDPCSVRALARCFPCQCERARDEGDSRVRRNGADRAVCVQWGFRVQTSDDRFVDGHRNEENHPRRPADAPLWTRRCRLRPPPRAGGPESPRRPHDRSLHQAHSRGNVRSVAGARVLPGRWAGRCGDPELVERAGPVPCRPLGPRHRARRSARHGRLEPVAVARPPRSLRALTVRVVRHARRVDASGAGRTRRRSPVLRHLSGRGRPRRRQGGARIRPDRPLWCVVRRHARSVLPEAARVPRAFRRPRRRHLAGRSDPGAPPSEQPVGARLGARAL